MEVKNPTATSWLINMSSYGCVAGKPEVDYVCNNHGTLTLQGHSLQTIIDLRDACDQLIAELEPEDEVLEINPAQTWLTEDTRPFYMKDARFYPPELRFYVHDVVSPPQQNIILGAFLTFEEADIFRAQRAASGTRRYAITHRDELGL